MEWLHSIPIGMEWAFHSYRNEHSIPIGMESHSLPILKKYATRTSGICCTRRFVSLWDRRGRWRNKPWQRWNTWRLAKQKVKGCFQQYLEAAGIWTLTSWFVVTLFQKEQQSYAVAAPAPMTQQILSILRSSCQKDGWEAVRRDTVQTHSPTFRLDTEQGKASALCKTKILIVGLVWGRGLQSWSCTWWLPGWCRGTTWSTRARRWGL